MKDNLQNSKVGLAHHLQEIEKLIERKDYVTALAQIREVKSTDRIGSFPVDTPSDKVGLFYYLSAKVLHHLGSYDEALETGQKAISIFLKLHDELGLAQTQYLTGLIYIDTGDLKLAEMEIRDALTGFRRIKYLKGTLNCLSRLSQIESIRGDYSKAIEYIQDAISYTERGIEPEKKAILYGNLGRMFLKIGNWDKAEKNLLLNTELSKQAENKLDLCRSLLSLGYVYFLKRELKKAKNCYDESLSLIQKNNCVRELTIYYEYSGELAFAQGDYQLAENHYKKVFEIMNERAPAGDMISQTYRLLANLQVAKKEYDQAFSSCKKALEVSKSLGERIEESACYRILGQIYTFRGDKEKAQENFNKSISIFQEIDARYELAKTYLEAGKSNCYDYYERMKYLGLAEDIFINLESKYHLGLVKLAHSNLFFDKQEYVSACLFLKDTEKIFKELGEEKELVSVSEFRNKLLKFNCELEVSEPAKLYTFSDIITQNQKMLDIIEQARQIKDTDMTILIEGETGTGKDLLANCIHYESKRKNKKLIPISCVAIPEHLLESELFGHKKGSFTSSSYDKKGLIEEADGSTLFLNEVGDLPLNIQAKLLGVMDNKELTRLGETRPRKVDFRVIAASNKNLEEAVKSGRFRDDLYFRLKVIEIVLPPLRERKEDILLLMEHYLKETGIAEDNLKLSEYPELIEKLQGYDWPGNIRELKNEIDKIAFSVINNEKFTLQLLSEKIINLKNCEGSENSSSLYGDVTEFQKKKIIKALEENNWIITRAAESLKIPEASLRTKLKKYGIKKPEPF